MIRTRILLLLAGAFLLLLAGICSTQAQTAQSPLPAPTGYVNDYAGVIDQATKDRLETTLANLDRQHQIQFAVVTVDTTGGQDIFDYSLAVARGWGIGSRDTQKPSLLLLVAIKDRKYFTQVSRHLEGDLPDGLAGQIQREHLVPAFRAGRYGEGLADTINEYIATLAEKQGFSTDTIFPAGTREARPPADGTKGLLGSCGIIVFVIAIIVVFLIVAGRGRGRFGGGGGGFLTGFLISSLINSLLSSGRGSRSSGWGGGGFGGFSGGGSGGGGFGGFGGGGDFGGGGAGGSW